MAEVIVINPTKELEPEQRKIRVAAYVRVSSDSEDQENSFINQYDYYNALISGNPEWSYVDIYADEHAIIGTSGENLVKSRVSALVPFHFFVKGKYKFI